MNISRLLSKDFWMIDNAKFREVYNYDLLFNASFRGKEKLSKSDMKLLQIRYLWYYRKAQATRGSLWGIYYMRKLVRFSEHTGIMLYENMNIPKGLIVGHPGPVIINSQATFEGNLFLTHGVTIGRDIRGKRAGAPHFGKNVCIRCNSTVVGGITIGEDVLIAPNTFVNFDVPSHSIVIGNPATIHHRDNATEGHIGNVEG
jgi:serine O-acetyltransferase